MTLRVQLDLACGLRLEQLLFSWDEMRWIYERHFFWSDPDTEADPHRTKVLNEWKLLVDFRQGLLMPRLKVSMHIIVPERLGKQHFLGVDISPGAKTYLEFYYERPIPRVKRPQDDSDPYWKGIPPENIPIIPGPFYLAEISRGARPPIDVRPLTCEAAGPGLVKPIEVEFPFPVLDRIPWQHGYAIPFLDEDHQVVRVTVPDSLRRHADGDEAIALTDARPLD